MCFVSNSQVIGCEDRLRNDLYCVGWGVKLYSIQSKLMCQCNRSHQDSDFEFTKKEVNVSNC